MQYSYLTKTLEDLGVHTFSQGSNLKVTVIARLEFERAYKDAKFQNFSFYVKRTPN